MKSKNSFSDEQIMAYADGELDIITADAITRATTTDSNLTSRISAFKHSRQVAKQAMDLQLAEPVPSAMEAQILALLSQSKSQTPLQKIEKTILEQTNSSDLQFIKQASNDNRRHSWAMTGIAASFALIIGAIAGTQLPGLSNANLPAQIAIGPLGDTEIAQLLATAPSGELRPLKGGGHFKVISTFNDAQNALCREFEIDGPDRKTIVSVVCRTGALWNLQFAVAAGQTGAEYAPASSLELLDSFYLSSGASAALSIEAERAAL